MRIIYTPYSAKIKPEKYQEWLSSLKNGDRVVRQVFEPGRSNTCFDFPFCRWEFTLGQIDIIDDDRHRSSFYTPTEHHPYSAVDGKAYFYGHQQEHCKVFVSRIVPVPHQSDFGLVNPGDWVAGTAPIFSPEYSGCHEHVFHFERRSPLTAEYTKIIQNYPCYYCDEDVIPGFLLHAFTHDDEEDVREKGLGERLVYSKFIEG